MNFDFWQGELDIYFSEDDPSEGFGAVTIHEGANDEIFITVNEGYEAKTESHEDKTYFVIKKKK